LAFVLCASMFIETKSQDCGVWKPVAGVDDFGEPTGTYILLYPPCSATFSNSATSGSKLGVGVNIASGSVGFILSKYDSSTSTIDAGFYDINVIRKSDKKEFEFHGWAVGGSPALYLNEKEHKKYIEVLQSDDEFSFRVVEVKEYGVPSVYRFIVKSRLPQELLDKYNIK